MTMKELRFKNCLKPNDQGVFQGVVAWSVKRSERALPETDFRRCVQNWDGQVRSSG